MFTSRAELLDKGETTAEHLTHRQEESERLDKDKSNTDPQNGGLFGGLFKPKPPPLHPIVDVDDGVMRCPQCNWELADDEVCAGCGYEYHGESDGTDYTDESDDFSGTENYDSIIDDEADEDGFGGIDDDHPVWGDFAVPGSWSHGHDVGLSWQDGLPALYHPGSHLPQFRLPPRPPGVILTDPSEYDDHYDDEENEYEMDSFIDDEEHQNREADDLQSEHSTVVDASRGWQPENNLPRPPIVRSGTITSDEDEDDDEDDEEDSVVGPPHRRPTGRAFTSHYVEDSEEEEDSEEDEDSLMVPQQPWGVSSSHGQERMSFPIPADDSEEVEDSELHMGRGRRYVQPVIDDDDEESDSSDSSSPPPRRPARPARTTGVSVGNAITIDDSDEEQPVGPVRRTAQRRHARFSPY